MIEEGERPTDESRPERQPDQRAQQLRSVGRLLYVVSASLLGMYLLYVAVPKLHDAVHLYPADLIQDHGIGRAFAEGYNPYTPEGRKRAGLTSGVSSIGHPPSSAVWLVPLVKRVDLQTANVAWGWITAFLLLVELMALFPLVGAPAPLVSAWLAFSFVLSWPLVVYHLNVGQLSVAIGFLTFVAWAAARRGDDVIAGIALGAACAMKPFPGLLVFLFLLWRRWTVVGAAVGVYLGVFGATVARFGISSWTIFLANERLVSDMWMGNIQNQAVFGIVLRLFHPACGPLGKAGPLTLLISVAISGSLIAVASWRALRARDPETQDLAFATFTVLSLVTPQWTWEHYDVIYILPIAIAGRALILAWRRGEKVAAAVGIGTVALVLRGLAMSVQRKIRYQRAFRAGDASAHFKLHLYEVLGWAPGVALLIVVGALFWRATRCRFGKPLPR